MQSNSADRRSADAPLVRVYLECQDELLDFLNRRLSCLETAKDLRHETYVRLQGIEDPASIIDPKSYIFGIARNLVINHVRNEGRRRTLLAEAGEIPWQTTESVTPEQSTIARAELEILRQAIPNLPPLTRRIFAACRFKGKSRRAVAQEFGVSTTTVDNHMRRAMEHFQDALKDLKSEPPG
ncbi:MAG: RNA polymerase sigma factor [Pseudomonadota bacterium]